MAFFSELISKVFGAVNGSGGGVLPILEKADGTGINAQAGANGGLAVEFASGATALATEATMSAIAALLPSPTLPTAITASDATDLTSLVNVGVLVGGAGDLAFRLTGAPSTTVTLAVVAGQFVPGQFTRVMAATTATNLVGLGR